MAVIMKPDLITRARRRQRSKSPIGGFSVYPLYDKSGNSTSCSEGASFTTSPSSSLLDIGSESTGSSDVASPFRRNRSCSPKLPGPKVVPPIERVGVLGIPLRSPPEETAVPTPRWVTSTPPASYRCVSEVTSKQFLYQSASRQQRAREEEDAITNPPESDVEVSWVLPSPRRSSTPTNSRSKSPVPDARQVEAALQDAEIARARAMRAIGYKHTAYRDDQNQGSRTPPAPADISPRFGNTESALSLSTSRLSRVSQGYRSPALDRSVSPRRVNEGYPASSVEVQYTPRRVSEGYPASEIEVQYTPRRAFEGIQHTLPCAPTFAQKEVQRRSGSFSPEPRVLHGVRDLNLDTPPRGPRADSRDFSPEPRVLPMPNQSRTPARSRPRSPRVHASREDVSPLRQDVSSLPSEAPALQTKPNAFDSFDEWRAQLRQSAGIALATENQEWRVSGGDYDQWRERLVKTSH